MLFILMTAGTFSGYQAYLDAAAPKVSCPATDLDSVHRPAAAAAAAAALATPGAVNGGGAAAARRRMDLLSSESSKARSANN